jgi:hypothetical protein
VWRPSNAHWWVLVTVAMFIVCAWPFGQDRSLTMQFVNWAVDPWDQLPVLPPPFDLAEGDDVQAVNAHDYQVGAYDEIYDKGGWGRTRLRLKVAKDPFDPATERPVLAAIGVLTAFLVWRSASERP